MGVPVLVIGFSGSGKSSSLRGFESGEIGVFSVAGKRLPFKTDLQIVDIEKKKSEIKEFDPYEFIIGIIRSPKLNAYAIDDSQYLMSFEEMDSDKTGFKKYDSIGFNFVGLVRFVRSSLPDDVIVYFFHHPEEEGGRIKPKTIGKLIDNHFTLEGLFEITIMAEYDKGSYVFRTETDGFTPLKNPPGMLQDGMPNDLKAVDAAIREYWNLAPLVAPKKTAPKKRGA